MSSRRQKLLVSVNWYLQSSPEDITELITGNKSYYRGGRYRQVSLYYSDSVAIVLDIFFWVLFNGLFWGSQQKKRATVWRNVWSYVHTCAGRLRSGGGWILTFPPGYRGYVHTCGRGRICHFLRTMVVWSARFRSGRGKLGVGPISCGADFAPAPPPPRDRACVNTSNDLCWSQFSARLRPRPPAHVWTYLEMVASLYNAATHVRRSCLKNNCHLTKFSSLAAPKLLLLTTNGLISYLNYLAISTALVWGIMPWYGLTLIPALE